MLTGFIERVVNKKRRRRVTERVIAMIVVFCTTYALILPAITWERTLLCSVPEHIHSEACYEEKLVPGAVTIVCPLMEHVHSDACCEAKRTLICGMNEMLPHIHGTECYDEYGCLICGMEESNGHTHSETCYQTEYILTCTAPEHLHAPECYTEAEPQLEKVLVCPMQEHIHSDACYDAPPAWDPGVYCGMIEHAHNEYCFFADGTLKCTIPEHTHTVMCLADKTADVENYDYWNFLMSFVPKTGDWAQDVLNIAYSQLGYQESQKNFEIGNDGTINGYSRFGAWAGMPYLDWCASFCSFCLHYAGVDKAMPTHAGCIAWMDQLKELGMFRESGTYIPQRGDLVFFYSQLDVNGVYPVPDHVGFVSDILLDEQGYLVAIKTIEGNIGDKVDEAVYYPAQLDLIWEPGMRNIMGYVPLPEKPAEPEEEKNDEPGEGMLSGETVEAPAVETVALPETAESSAPEDLTENAETENESPNETEIENTDKELSDEELTSIADLTEETEEKEKPEGETAEETEEQEKAEETEETEKSEDEEEPAEPEQFELTAETQEGIVVTVSGAVDSLPYPAEEITLVASVISFEENTGTESAESAESEGIPEEEVAVSNGTETTEPAEASSEENNISDGTESTETEDASVEEIADPEIARKIHVVLDVTMFHGYEIIEPTGPVIVRFSGITDNGNLSSQVLHADGETGTDVEMPSYVEEDGTVVMETDHFSVYDISLMEFPALTVIFGAGDDSPTFDVQTSWNGQTLTIDSITVTAPSGKTLQKDKYYALGYSSGKDQYAVYTATSGKTPDKATEVIIPGCTIPPADPTDRVLLLGYADDESGKNLKTQVQTTFADLFEAETSGFKAWLNEGFFPAPSTFGDLCRLYGFYLAYLSNNPASVSLVHPDPDPSAPLVRTTKINLSFNDSDGTYQYIWEYKDTNGVWQTLDTVSDKSSLSPANYPILSDGLDNQIRCKVNKWNEDTSEFVFYTVSNAVTYAEPAADIEITADVGSSFPRVQTITLTGFDGDPAESYEFSWEYKDENDAWQTLIPRGITTTFYPADYSVLNNGRDNEIRCSVYRQEDTSAYTFSNSVTYAKPAAEIEISTSEDSLPRVTTAALTGFDGAPEQTYHYVWQFREPEGDWQLLAESASGEAELTEIEISSYAVLMDDAEHEIRCSVLRLQDGTPDPDSAVASNTVTFDPDAVIEKRTDVSKDGTTRQVFIDLTEFDGAESGSFRYTWECFDSVEEEWVAFQSPDEEDLENTNLKTIKPADYSVLTADGDHRIRCSITNAADENVPSLASSEVEFNPLEGSDSYAIGKINEFLSSYTIMVGSGATVEKTIDLSYGTSGSLWEHFYWTNLINDSRAIYIYDRNGDGDAADSDEYIAELVKLYYQGGMPAVEKVWDRYVLDMYDPSFSGSPTYNGGASGSSTGYPTKTYGDDEVVFPKDGNSSSFHSTSTLKPEILDLDINFMENGVDYANFVTGMGKTAKAAKAGDENNERKYTVDITADCQAKARAPIAMILQIQTSWQMFDYRHATYDTYNKSVAYNDQIANLYDIKQALLRFVDYMETNMPGNNLVLGITETRHTDTQTMFQGTMSNSKYTDIPLYVTNNYSILKEGLINWDTFGNCEHVHYSTSHLVKAVTNLAGNLYEWKDNLGKIVEYNDIQKVAVIVGGGTENVTGDNGYTCTVPWGTMKTYGINSVYGIRTNVGTSRDSGLLSWLDYSGNNTGDPYNYDPVAQTGASTCFTHKYVAPTEDQVFQSLVDIAKNEMNKKGVDVTAQDKYIENATLNDTVKKEFALTGTNGQPVVVATVMKKDGTPEFTFRINVATGEVTCEGANLTVPGTRTVSENADVKTTKISFTAEQSFEWADEDELNRTETWTNPMELTITENTDGTTDVVMNFGRVYNTKKLDLSFDIQAKEDYLGSNNVYTNKSTPALNYKHTRRDQDGNVVLDENGNPIINSYPVSCPDTPQVNVPLSVKAENGGTQKVLVGDEIDIGDTVGGVDSRIVVSRLEEFLQKSYSQINGTLKYEWVDSSTGQTLADSTQEVTIRDGMVQVGDQKQPPSEENLPPITYPIIPEQPGTKTYSLRATFTPTDIDPANPNFKQDGITNVRVEPKSDAGNVTIIAVKADTNMNYFVRKIWDDDVASADHSPVTFTVTDGFGQFVNQDPDTGVCTLGDTAQEFTLSDADKVVGEKEGEYYWQLRLADLPPTKGEGADKKILEYAAVEAIPEGYAVSYSDATQTEEQWVGQLSVTLTNASGDVDSKNIVHLVVDFTYNSNPYSIDATAFTADATDKWKKEVTRTFTVNVDEFALPLTANHLSYGDITNISAYTYKGKKGDGSLENRIDSSESSATVTPVMIGEKQSPVLVMTNAPATKPVMVKKTVDGPSTDQTFHFTAVLNEGKLFPAPAEGANYELNEARTEASFTLGHGQSVPIVVPIGSEFTVTESDYTGYTPYVKLNDVAVQGGFDSVTVTVTAADDYEIEFVNHAGAVLPSTGGMGLIPLYTFGAFLVFGSLWILFKPRRRCERRNN